MYDDAVEGTVYTDNLARVSELKDAWISLMGSYNTIATMYAHLRLHRP